MDDLEKIQKMREQIAALKQDWDLYTESVTRAAEAARKSCEKIREATRALEEREKIHETGRKAAAPEDEYAEQLRHATKVLDARVKQRAVLLRVKEEGELKQAGTHEEQARIRARYNNAIQEIEDEGAERRLMLVRNTIDQIDKDIAANEGKRRELTEEIARKASKKSPDADGIEKLNKEVAGLDETIAELVHKRTRYNTQLQTDSDTTYIGIETHEMERVERALGPGDDTIAGGVAASFAARAGRISEQQRQAFADLAELYTAVFGNTVHLTQALQYSLQHHLNQQQEIQLIKNQIQALTQNHR